ncbi:MAG: lysine--tRNA ligase [Chloroflexi bacterium]|nr:lysine--tRNA ligase [Chloroflexota bacterium]
MLDREDGLLGSRNAKLIRLRQRGIDPYPPRFHRSTTASDAIASFEASESADSGSNNAEDADSKSVTLAGRITSVRIMGRASFLDLRDGSGTIQALLRENVLGQDYQILKDLDLGDFIGVGGELMRTRTGQITVDTQQITLLSKGMRPLPEKYHGLRDTEIRYRQRYLDLIANPEVMTTFTQRGQIISGIRRFLDGRGFLEVDTPIMVPVAGGAHARPFITHHNALDQQLYLRIATELYLKRLIVGGFDKVYELGRVFRNEGIDQDHNPEFTLLESYEAYADYNDVMTMVEQMVATIAQEVRGTTQIPYGEHIIDFTPPWPRVQLREELERRSGVNIDDYPDDASLTKRAAQLGLQIGPRESRGRLIDKMLSTFVEPHLIQPTFMLDYPEDMSPLAKSKPGCPGYVERFEAFAAGMEIANSYTELNDPVVQRQRFEAQEEIRKLYQDDEVDRKDEDFLLALEYGMPPTGGLGMGIDRLVMLLTGQPSIRDILFFPQMRTIRGAPGDAAA